MSFYTYLRGLFGSRSSGLRNRAGGMAWIRFPDECGGARALNGHIVKTLEVGCDGLWAVDPNPAFVTSCALISRNGVRVAAGVVVRITRIEDTSLIPIRGAGVSAKEVERLYQSSPAPQPKQPA